MAAWRTGHRPGTTPQQWGMARVNSYITKGKTYHTADKDLHEDAKEENLSDDELDKMVNTLQGDDLVDLFDEEEEEEKEEVKEALSPATRLKKARDFARTGTKRGIARKLKLNRPASTQQLENRAKMAARRLLSRRFLKGRNREDLSPQEKDMLEQRLAQLQKMGIQTILAQKLMTKVRKLQQQRLKSR
jgi:ribosomal protein S14